MAHNLGMSYQMPQPGLFPPNFKSPSEQSQLMSSAPVNPKKRRKTTNASVLPPQPPPSPQDLLPPPLTGYGDTIIASNPFDDTPTTMNMNHGMGGHMMMHGMNPHMHMGGSPIRSMHMNMNPMVGMNNMGPGMGPMGPHMGPNRGCMNPGMPVGMNNANMGGMSPHGNVPPNMSPMGQMGGMPPMNNQNPHSNMNSGMPPSNRSMGSPMSGGPINSPMSGMSMGSPMNTGMSSPLGGGPSHMNGQMGPPMHSPLGGNSNILPAPRINGSINSGGGGGGGGGGGHQMQSHQAPNSSISIPSSNINLNSGQITSNSSMNAMGSGAMNHHGIMSQSMQVSPNSGGGGSGGGGGGISGNNNNVINSNMMTMGGMNHMQQMTNNGPVNNPQNSMGGPGVGMFGPKPMPISAGKVYPPGQPMVFNPQNPSAPPIYACGVCHKEVNDNDEALFCESGCNFFFHRTCTGLTEAAFQLISKEIFAEWCCDKCLSSKSIPLVKFKC